MKRASHQRRVSLLALLAGFPAVLTSLWILWSGDYSAKVQWTLTTFILCFYFGAMLALRERVIFPLQTLSNLLAALREGDYSIRARGATYDDALGEVLVEVNALGETLREQRLGALEATALLRTVMAEIDVAVFTFDGEHRLRFLNRAAEKLLSRPAEQVLARSAADLGLEECLSGDAARTVQLSFPGSTARWGLRRTTLRQGGLPHHLLVLTDLSRALREEERQAWQRLIRVLGHELNNSLTPIKSMAGSLETLLARQPRPADWQADMHNGLRVIESRAESLARFMAAYARLAKLPPPQYGAVDVGAWVRRAAGLETRLHVDVDAGPEMQVRADGDQLEQLLINLLRNAVDASLETGGAVRVGWEKRNGQLEVWVRDEGPGISNAANLFVPFFTTKPTGSGIGLVLSRQIAEAHGGSLDVHNRDQARGCEARLSLPLATFQ